MNRILRNIVLWVLFGAGLVVCGLTAFILQSDVELATETILFGAYAFGIISLLAVVFSVVVMGAINDPKSLLKLLGGIAAIAAVVFIAWFLAPGTQPIGYLGDPVVDPQPGEHRTEQDQAHGGGRSCLLLIKAQKPPALHDQLTQNTDQPANPECMEGIPQGVGIWGILLYQLLILLWIHFHQTIS